MANRVGRVEDGQTAQSDGWPAPLAEPAYAGVIGEIVRTIEPHTEADPAAILTQLLVMFGSVIGRSAHFRVDADVHHLNLFVGITGQTAKGRKGLSHSLARRMYEPVDPDWTRGCLTSGLSSGEGLIWAVRDAIEKQQPIKEGGRVVEYQKVIEDPGVTDKRLLVTESELASTLKVMAREGNTLSPVIRQAWDGDNLRTLTKTSTARATSPYISIIGHITGDELRRHLDATEVANGFGNRFLWVCVRRSRELPDGGGRVDLVPHIEQLRVVVDEARHVGEMRRDAEAGRLWHHVYGRLSAARPGMLGAITGRAEAQVMRLACLYALGDRSSVVSPRHLRAALEVWRYCFQSAAYIFGAHLGDPIADEILRALRDHYPESLSRTEILHDVFGRNQSAARIARALGLLADCRFARHERDRSGEGRPTERWYASEKTAADYDVDDFYDDSQGQEGGKVVKVVNVVAPSGKQGEAERWTC